MNKPTVHQKDLIIDEVVRISPVISFEDLLARAKQKMPQITESNLRKRVEYDITLQRASKRADGRIIFYTSDMAERTVKPFKG